MFKHQLIEQNFLTPIGTIVCGLTSTDSKIEVVGQNTYNNGKSIVYKTASYIVEVIAFKQRLPLYNGELVNGCQGWIWRITKQNADHERIVLHCLMTNMADDVTTGSDPGEHLESFAASNKSWTVHIGTEDDEVMQSRARNDDWMPTRYINDMGFVDSFTDLQSNGFTTTVPDLAVDEKIHFHYLTAYDEYSETKVNTWLAVEEFKRSLENWIGVW